MKEMVLVEANEIVVPERFRKDMGDIDELAKSIHENGLIQPIAISPEKVLLAGARRLEACKRLRMRMIKCNVIEHPEPIVVEKEENECRKEFSLTEKTAIAKAILALQGDGRKDHHDDDRVEGIRRDKAAAVVGISGATYSRANKVCLKGCKALQDAMDRKEIPVLLASKVADLPTKQQQEIVRQVRNGIPATRAYEEVSGHLDRKTPGEAWEGKEFDPELDGGHAERFVTHDRLGNSLPSHLRDAFNSTMLEDNIEALRILLKTLHNAAIWNRFLLLADIQQHIKMAQDLIASSLPFAVCPECSGKRSEMDRCKACRSCGWMNENAYAEARVLGDQRKKA